VTPRGTKLAVVLWACAAVAAQAWLLGRAWAPLPQLALLIVAGTAALAWFDRRAVALVLVFAYVFPALIWFASGLRPVSFGILWMAGLLGAMLPDALRTSWHVPTRWRGALVLWALIVVVTVPVLVLRELDFFPGLFYVSGAPRFAIMWILHVALILVLGILWFDWLFGARDLDFHAGVATPLAASAAVMAAVAAYQLFVDFFFLNPGLFGAIGRAPGTVFDANVSGAVGALWIGGVLLWGRRLGSTRPWLVAAGFALAWIAVWASGSRTAFVSAALVTGFAAVSLAIQLRRGTIRLSPRRLAVVAAAVVGLLLVLLVGGANQQVVGPVARLWDQLPEPDATVASWRVLAETLWTRGGYGLAANAMIQEFPFFGVGVSFFHDLTQYAGPIFRLAPDNAQNWYRHQLAEFGIIGSLGWIAWVIAFAYFVLRRHRDAPPAAWTARGVLVAFALISLVGMPGQDVSVVITFWTMAFWYVSLVGIPPQQPALSRRAWGMILAIVVIHAAGTLHLAATRLRPPVRAQHYGIPYAYGFYAPEPDGPLAALSLDPATRRHRRRRAAALDGTHSRRQPRRCRREARGRQSVGGRKARAEHDADERRVRHLARSSRATGAAGADRDAGQPRRQAARGWGER
jgi:hypothetical protein